MPEYGATKMYPGDNSEGLERVIFRVGGERSGRDLYCQLAEMDVKRLDRMRAWRDIIISLVERTERCKL
jgi:hypothetical protein